MSTHYLNRPPSTTRLRLVWAAVTAHPGWSQRQLAADIGVTSGSVAQALWYLEQAGYIQRGVGKAQAIQVLVPFVAPVRRLPRKAAYPRSAITNPANWELSAE